MSEDVVAQSVNVKNIGLRGVTVADTKISFIDGDNGILLYRGYRIEELVELSSFMEVAFLLLNGYLPKKKELEDFESALKDARDLPAFFVEILKKCPANADPMDMLQTGICLMAMFDPGPKEESRETHIRKSLRLIASIPAMIAAWHRIRQGLEPVPPDERLSHAANFLWQLHGSEPDEKTASVLDKCLILHAEHTFNASTFACRQVVSTQARLYAGVAASLGALSGRLHGGANSRVMEMLLALENEKDIDRWVTNELDHGRRIMGMGHAVYKTMDPRAGFLKQMAVELGVKTGMEKWRILSEKLEASSIREFRKRGKTDILPNVDFYSAPVYFMMGIPPDLMTPVFAMSRIVGWCAHIIEEKFAEAQEKPALYRPKAEYVGQYFGLTGCRYESLVKKEEKLSGS
ncbi:MAG: citrate (Si)-synthase [Deltaproteobacteria bacterium]|nr:MAG: citrate (Si)-synthase [Deltaproteobacteria bacterium]